MLPAPRTTAPPVRWLHLDQRQARKVIALADEMGFTLWPQPVELLVSGRLVADVDLAMLEAAAPGFVESLRFPSETVLEGRGPRETWDGYCRHGVYVGGCGADYMCARCECGEE